MIIERWEQNPVLKPDRGQSWEAEAVFNGCPAKKGNRVYLLYRALSLPHYHTAAQTKMAVSDIGIAESADGLHFKNRKRFIVPEHAWERFGCEDPRITELNGTYYIFYTALSEYPFRAEGIRVGLAISHDLEKIDEKHLITPFNAKGMALFPEKIDGKIWAVLTANTDKPPSKICVASFEEEKDFWSPKKWEQWYQHIDQYSLPLQRTPHDHIEVGAPPIKTKDGWLLLYSYIRNYFSPQRVFTVEAVLLDLRNPMRVVARMDMPLLMPEEYYEKIGIVPEVVFPSGAIVKRDCLYLYYGAADTTCCVAFVQLPALLQHMLRKGEQAGILTRARENPIIIPQKDHEWEKKAAFNPAALYLMGNVHLLYRAMSVDNTSVFGYAVSKDGIHIDYRAPHPVYTPREPFEQKLQPGGNSGCEDPRLTRISNTIYMCYTAFDGKSPPRVALTSISVRDFLAQQWNWGRPVPISPPGFDDKDAFVFPAKIHGKYMIVHRSGDDIDYSFCASLEFGNNQWLEEHRWITPRRGWWDSKKIGSAAPPIKTKEGWLLLYHGVSEEGVYRVGAVLLDRKDPLKIIGRTDDPILEPEKEYEIKGQVPNVVFPCGMVLIDETLFVYYGGGDTVTGVATAPVATLLRTLKL